MLFTTFAHFFLDCLSFFIDLKSYLYTREISHLPVIVIENTGCVCMCEYGLHCYSLKKSLLQVYKNIHLLSLMIFFLVLFFDSQIFNMSAINFVEEGM